MRFTPLLHLRRGEMVLTVVSGVRQETFSACLNYGGISRVVYEAAVLRSVEEAHVR